MSLSYTQIAQILLTLLTPGERQRAIAYLAEHPVSIGELHDAAGHPLDVPPDDAIAFIDGEPTANWAHRSRYILIDRETGETRSVEAQFPPMSRVNPGSWHMVYKAPSVLDDFVMVPPAREKER